MEMVENVAKKLNLENEDNGETPEEKVIDFIEKKAEKQLEKGGKKVSSDEVIRQVTKEAEDVVKKAQKKTEEAVKKVVVAQEAGPGGIIDMVSKELAHNANVQAKKEENRVRIETAIATRAAATDTKITTTRDSLKSGFKATREAEGSTKK